MSAITATATTKRLTVGDRVMQTFTVSVLGDNATDEWVATGLSWIDAVVGFGPIGTAPFLEVPSFLKNAQGTGGTGGANPGDLGVEVDETDADTFEVTVIGIP